MKILYIAPDVPVLHTGEFLGRFNACVESGGKFGEERL